VPELARRPRCGDGDAVDTRRGARPVRSERRGRGRRTSTGESSPSEPGDEHRLLGGWIEMSDQFRGAVPRALGCDEACSDQLAEPLLSLSYRPAPVSSPASPTKTHSGPPAGLAVEPGAARLRVRPASGYLSRTRDSKERPTPVPLHRLSADGPACGRLLDSGGPCYPLDGTRPSLSVNRCQTRWA